MTYSSLAKLPNLSSNHQITPQACRVLQATNGGKLAAAS